MNTKAFLIMLALFALASPMMAADGQTNWVAISSGFSMAIASGLCGLAQGKAVASSAEALARNPGAAASIASPSRPRANRIAGLYTLVIVFIKVV